jgi:hypothetical protein
MTQAHQQRITEERVPPSGNWYLLMGIVIGFLAGLVISWIVVPVKYIETTPASLRADFKDEFRSQIASVFFFNHNLPRAQARLLLLADLDPVQALTTQAQRLVSLGDPGGKAYQLSYLAEAISVSFHSATEKSNVSTTSINLSGISQLSTGTGSSLTSTVQPSQTFDATLSTLGAPSIIKIPQFFLKSSQNLCDALQDSSLLQVEVLDSLGQPMPGVKIIITWAYGQDYFFTGIKTENGNGYADFLMTPGVTYNLQLVMGNVPVSNITAPICTDDSGVSTWGNVYLVFQLS